MNTKLFESLLLNEGYKENDDDRKRFNSITRQQIEDRFDCTILSGPHDDKTGPCYCVDDHDHEIHILHMKDILEAFKSNDMISVGIISDNIFDEHWGEVLDEDKNDVYEYFNGKEHLIVVTGKRAVGFVDEVLDTAENSDVDLYHRNDKCYVIAVSKSVEAELNRGGFGYDVGDIMWESNELADVFVDQDYVHIPDFIKQPNGFVLKGVESSFQRMN